MSTLDSIRGTLKDDASNNPKEYRGSTKDIAGVLVEQSVPETFAPEDPVDLFKKAFAAGTQNLYANMDNFSASIASIRGDEDGMEVALADAERKQMAAGSYLAETTQFEDYLDAPTFGGFMEQFVLATGQFAPSAIASIATALTGAGAGALVAGAALRGGAGTVIASQGTKYLASGVPKKMVTLGAFDQGIGEYAIKQAVEKKIKLEVMKKQGQKTAMKMTSRQDDIINAIYPYLQKQVRKKNMTMGALTGAAASEYPQGTGIAFQTYAEQGMKDPISSFKAQMQGTVFSAIGIGSEAAVFAAVKNSVTSGKRGVRGFASNVASTTAITSASEGIAETLQEELSVQQKFRIDKEYTAEQARLDRIHAAFAGFVGGAGLGAGLGSGGAAINYSREMTKDARTRRIVRDHLGIKYNEPLDDQLVYAEPKEWLRDMFAALKDPRSGKKSVWVDQNSMEAYEEIAEELQGKYGLIPGTQLEGAGVLFSFDEQVLTRFNNVMIKDRWNSAMLEETLAGVLGFSRGRLPGDDAVVEVINNKGNVVWYQQTKAGGVDEQSAIAAAEKIKGTSGRYTIQVKDFAQHKEERAELVPQEVERILGAQNAGNKAKKERETELETDKAEFGQEGDFGDEGVDTSGTFVNPQTGQREFLDQDNEITNDYQGFDPTPVVSGRGSEAEPILRTKFSRESIDPKTGKAEFKRVPIKSKDPVTGEIKETRNPKGKKIKVPSAWPSAVGYKNQTQKIQELAADARRFVDDAFLAEFNANVEKGKYSESLLAAFIKESSSAEMSSTQALRIEPTPNSLDPKIKNTEQEQFHIIKYQMDPFYQIPEAPFVESMIKKANTYKAKQRTTPTWTVVDAKDPNKTREAKDKKGNIKRDNKGNPFKNSTAIPVDIKMMLFESSQFLKLQKGMPGTAQQYGEQQQVNLGNLGAMLENNGYELRYKGQPLDPKASVIRAKKGVKEAEDAVLIARIEDNKDEIAKAEGTLLLRKNQLVRAEALVEMYGKSAMGQGSIVTQRVGIDGRVVKEKEDMLLGDNFEEDTTIPKLQKSRSDKAGEFSDTLTPAGKKIEALEAELEQLNEKIKPLQNRDAELREIRQLIMDSKKEEDVSILKEANKEVEGVQELLENNEREIDELNEELGKARAGLKKLSEELATQRQGPISKPAPVTFDPGADIDQIAGTEGGAAGGTTGASVTVPLDQSPQQERTRRAVANNQSAIRTKIRNAPLALQKAYRDVLDEISEINENTKAEPSTYTNQTAKRLADLDKQKTKLEAQLEITTNVSFLKALTNEGTSELQGLDTRTKDTVLESTDDSSVAAEIEFNSRWDRHTYLDRRKEPIFDKNNYKFSSTVEAALGVPGLVKLLINSLGELGITTPVKIYSSKEAVIDTGDAKVNMAVLQAQKDLAESTTTTGINIRGPEFDTIILKIDNNISDSQRGRAIMTLAHELGHTFVRQKIQSILKNPKLRDALLSQYEKSIEGIDQYSPTSEAGPSLKGFEEWVADQVGVRLLQEAKSSPFKLGPPAKNQVESFFTRLVKNLKAFFSSIKDSPLLKRFIPNAAFSDFADGLNASLQEEAASPRENTHQPNFEVQARIDKTMEELNMAEGLTQKTYNKLNTTAQKLIRSDKAPGWLKQLVYTTDNILRQLDPLLADFMYNQSSSETPTGFLTAAQQVTQRKINQLGDILGVDWIMTQDAKDVLTEAQDELTDTKDLSPKAKKVREFLDKHFDELDLASIGIDKKENFFPRIIAVEEIAMNETLKTKLITMLVENNKGNTFTDTEGNNFVIDSNLATIIVESIIKDPNKASLDLSEAQKSSYNLGLLKHRADAFKALSTKELNEAGLLLPPEVAIRNYIRNSVRKAEFEKRGGAKFLAARVAALPKAQQKVAKEAIDASMGKISPIENSLWRNTTQVGLVFNVLTLLSFAVLASFPDLAGPLLRSRELKSFKTSYGLIWKQYIKGENGGWQAASKLARDIGVIGIEAMSTMFINAGELENVGTTSKKVTDFWFKWTGLEHFTRFTRVFAAGMGKSFIEDHAVRAKNGEIESVRMLNQLGNLKYQEVLDWMEGGSDINSNPRINQALARFVDESIVRPNAAERPMWASDPRFALVWQLKSFFYAYGKNIMGGTMRESRARYENGGFTDASMPFVLAAITLLPLTALGFDIRERTKGMLAYMLPGIDSTEKNYRKSLEMSGGEYTLELVERSGAPGPFGLALPLLFESKRYGDPIFIQGLGPSVEMLYDISTGGANASSFLPVIRQL